MFTIKNIFKVSDCTLLTTADNRIEPQLMISSYKLFLGFDKTIPHNKIKYDILNIITDYDLIGCLAVSLTSITPYTSLVCIKRYLKKDSIEIFYINKNLLKLLLKQYRKENK